MNKPPMTVWLDRHAAGVQTLGFYSPNKECLHVEGNMTTFGPYVHLEQFMEEVERRAKVIERGLKLTFGSWNQACGIAFKQLTEELKEQNEN